MRLLLAVSGGIDSMCMAHQALHGTLMSGHDFGIAHCNFHLREEESDGDESMVRQFCLDNGVAFHKVDFDTLAYSSSMGISIEMAARELRYTWFAKICREHGYDAVAVAHNANDAAETFLLNLLRGTGGRGLRGMSEDSMVLGVRVIRPLLRISRKEIEQYAASNCVPFREDRTNSEIVYKRNKLRLQVMPVFEEINPSYLEAMRRDMEHLREENDIAEDYYREAAEACLSHVGENITVDIPKLLSHRHWKYVLFRIMEPIGMSREILLQLIHLLEKPGATISGRRFHASRAAVGIIRKRIIISPLKK